MYCFSKKNNFIKYYPVLKRAIGSEQGALIFQQLEYWSCKYETGFWKFLEPCKQHPQYRVGDSWKEELGFSRRVFNKAFDLIGIRYKSKSDYLTQIDPFQGKMYLSYYDRKHNKTYFLRNHSFVKNFLTSLWQTEKFSSPKIQKEAMQKCRSCNSTNGRSFTRAEDISLQRSTSSFKLNESNRPLVSKDLEKEKNKNSENKKLALVQEMLNIWNQVTGNRTTLRSDFIVKFPEILQRSFQNSLNQWKTYCHKIASSKFLMGESSNSRFKAYLAWLIKPETIQKIEEGVYSLGDREINTTITNFQETFDREKVQGSAKWKTICEHLSSKLGYATFKSWFESLKLEGEESLTLEIKCPSLFMRDYIKLHYGTEIERIIYKLMPQTKNIEICV